MSEFWDNLWAPWRMQYIQNIEEQNAGGCFLCRYWNEREKDDANLVLWRTDRLYVVMNRYPYSNGHLLVCPAAHKAEMDELDDQEMVEVMYLVRDARQLLSRAVKAQGANVGMNFGHCAGAGLPGHLHVHIVPRWQGDTNFMTVLGDVRVIPQALDVVHQRLREVSREMGLPRVGRIAGS